LRTQRHMWKSQFYVNLKIMVLFVTVAIFLLYAVISILR
jgi:hypothetical protein